MQGLHTTVLVKDLMGFRAGAVVFIILLFVSMLSHSSGQSTNKMNEIISDAVRDLYVVKVTESELPETRNKLVSVQVICKNKEPSPNSCWSLKNFKLLDTDGRDYEASSELSEVSNLRIAEGDIMRSITSFVMTPKAIPAQLIFDEPPSKFVIDLTQSKNPKDVPPKSDWILTDNTGKKVDDGVMELTIISATSSGREYRLDISFKNIGYKEEEYDFRNLYLKDENGLVYEKPLPLDKHLTRGSLQPGQLVRMIVSFEILHPSDRFMVVYDKSSFFLHTGDSTEDAVKSGQRKPPHLIAKSITVTLDKTTYRIGNVVKIHANVSEVTSTPGLILILNPENEVYKKIQFYPNPDRSFAGQFELEQDSIARPGLWMVRAIYLTDIVDTTFKVREKERQVFKPSALAVSQARIFDENGHIDIHTVKLNSVVGIESELTDTSPDKITFASIAQIRDEEGFTVAIMWTENWSVLPGGSVKPQFLWLADSYGDYQAEVFIWTSLTNPLPLTSEFRLGFSVPPKWNERAAEFSSRVSHSRDDAEETSSTGDLRLGSTDLELVKDGSEIQVVGMRFQNVQIPQGVAIISARIYFTVDEADSEKTDLTFYTENTDDAPSFTHNNNDISNRTKTRASVDWNNVLAWDTVHAIESTPDLSPIIQEIIDRPGWTGGNSIVIIVTGSGERTAESYDDDPDLAPLLVVNYVIEES